MNRNIFGGNSNLPPGCRLSDIPGNRPEDEAWEKMTLEFYENKLTKEEWDKVEPFVEIVDRAIEYGIEVGNKQAEDIRLANKYYENRFVDNVLEEARQILFEWATDRLNEDIYNLNEKLFIRLQAKHLLNDNVENLQGFSVQPMPNTK